MARGDAAKKAWALYRAKYGTKSRSPSRSGGGTVSRPRKRRRFLGVLGKSGVMIMAGAPLVGSGIQAVERALTMRHGHIDFSWYGKLQIGWSVFINGLSKGFGMKEPYKSIWIMTADDNLAEVHPTALNVPDKVWWATTASGGIMFAMDRLIAQFTGAAVKSPIGGFYITGR